MRLLGIETSCDETAVAVIEHNNKGKSRILSNIVWSQIDHHAPYGGVVPEIAARAHIEILDGLILQALTDADLKLKDIDAIAATSGPGLIGGLLVGLMSAKALAFATRKPFIGVNHLEGHALTAVLTHNVNFPYLLLLVSGGILKQSLFMRWGITSV
ncbi:N6-L-threonylcarbamoyladenine synthase [Bartonella sp. 114]|nr:N6-L-threonylcarbamoyladenine synthase [Bartonella sp. 114]